MVDTTETPKNVTENSNNNTENTKEEEYFEIAQDILSNGRIPEDFDTWTAQKQRDWLNQNVITFLPNMPESLQGFIPAAFCPINTKRPLEKLPEWMDMDKYRRGQKFVRDHYFSLVLSKIFGLIYSYTFDDGRKIVFLGENSHTPYLAFTKYSSSLHY